MYCKHCGTLINENSRFCTNCGQVVQAKPVCKSCKGPLEAEDKFCPTCGTSVLSTSPQVPVQSVATSSSSLPPLLNPNTVRPPKKSKKLLLIPLVAILLIISIILGITYLPSLLGPLFKDKVYATSQGKVKKGSTATVDYEAPIANVQGISIDFSNLLPEEELVLEVSPISNATDQGLGKALASYRITADNEEYSEFDGLVTITIPINMEKYEDIDICAAYFDEEAQRWIPLPHETLKESDEVRIYTNHFTDFSVFKLTGTGTRFTTAAVNLTIIQDFLRATDYENIYGHLKAGNTPLESDFVTMGLGFMSFTSTAYDAKITLSTITKGLPLSEVNKLSSALTKIGFGIVLLKAGYEYFVLDSSDQAAHTLLIGLTELGIFMAAGAVGGPVAATLAFTAWGTLFMANTFSSYLNSKDIETAIKTQQEFVDSQYLYCINVRSKAKSGSWYYRYNSPVYSGSGSGWIAFKAGSDADWLRLFKKLYELNKNDPYAFMAAVESAVDLYHQLWSRTPANVRGNQWRGYDDPMYNVKYPSLSANDELKVTATIRENLRKRLTPIISNFKKEIHLTMMVAYCNQLEEVAADFNKEISFALVSENNDDFYENYKNSVFRFAVPDEMLKGFSEVDEAKWSNRWRFPSAKKDETLLLDATFLGYFLAGSPTTLNIFNSSSSLRNNTPDQTVDFKLERPNTTIVIPEIYPNFSEILGVYENGTLVYEDIFISEPLRIALDNAIKNWSDDDDAGCEMSEVKANLLGEINTDTMTISGSSGSGYISFAENYDDYETIGFTYNENKGELIFTSSNVRGKLTASYSAGNTGVIIRGMIRSTEEGFGFNMFYIDTRINFEKPLK